MMGGAQSWISAGLAISVLFACRLSDKSAPTPSASSSDPDDEQASRSEDQIISGEGFAFGPPSESGLSIGLRVENPHITAGQTLHYWVALRNQGNHRMERWLYNDMDSTDRTQLAVTRPGGGLEPLGKAVGWRERSTTNLGILMALDPSDAKERPGNPIVIPASLVGEAEIVLIFGRKTGFDFELRSGAVHVDVLPAAR